MSNVTFDNGLVKSFTPTINLLIRQGVNNYNHSDMCYEYEDVFQECLMHLWNATKIFNENRGMKFNTFAIMHIKSRLGSFRNKVVRRAKNNVYSMSEINSGWDITGTESDDDYKTSQYESSYSSLKENVNASDDLIDAKNSINKMNPKDQMIFCEYFLSKRSVKDISLKNNLTTSFINKRVKYLNNTYKSLKG